MYSIQIIVARSSGFLFPVLPNLIFPRRLSVKFPKRNMSIWIGLNSLAAMKQSTTTSCAPKHPARSIFSSCMAAAASVLIAVFCGADTVHAQNYVYFPIYGYGNQYPGAVSSQGGMVAGEQFTARTNFTFNSLGF